MQAESPERFGWSHRRSLVEGKNQSGQSWEFVLVLLKRNPLGQGRGSPNIRGYLFLCTSSWGLGYYRWQSASSPAKWSTPALGVELEPANSQEQVSGCSESLPCSSQPAWTPVAKSPPGWEWRLGSTSASAPEWVASPSTQPLGSTPNQWDPRIARAPTKDQKSASFFLTSRKDSAQTRQLVLAGGKLRLTTN